MAALSGAELEVPGRSQPRRLQRLVSVGRVVDPASRTFPVIYEVDNRDRGVAVNQTVYVSLLTAATKPRRWSRNRPSWMTAGGRSFSFRRPAKASCEDR